VRDYPTLAELLVMHEILLAEFGGAAGVRDMGALESALMRPQLGYYDTLVDEAAALLESLAMNHPFVDGNKRVAFFGTDTFLRLNDHFIDCDNEEAYRFFMGLFDSGRFRFAELREWLLVHVRPL
jgi:death-on-curing protein